MSKKCPTCKSQTNEQGHLCTPVYREDTKCDWCGSLIPDQRHICDKKLKDLSYVCNSCGRIAVKPEHLCDPKKVE